MRPHVSRATLIGAVTLWLFGLAALGCSGGPDADPSSDAKLPDPASEPDIDSFVEDVLASVGMPGVQTAVIKDGKVVWAKSYGNAIIAPLPEQPMTNDTILGLGGTSNELISFAFMQQVEAGKIGLDDDISQTLPWPLRNPHYPDVPITWRMVLSETAAFNDDPRAYDTYVFGEDSPVSFADCMRDLYAPTGQFYSADTFADERPGTIYHSSDFALGLAAYAIELLLGEPFHEYVRQHIVDPLGMESTSYFLRDLPTERLGVGYTCDVSGAGFTCSTPNPAGTVLQQQHAFPHYPVALLRTSAVQYLKFMAMLMNGGEVGDSSVLSRAGVDQLFEPLSTSEDGDQHGLFFREMPGWEALGDRILWGNGGADLGVASSLYFDRESRVGAIAIGNSQTSDWSNSIQMRLIVSKLLSEFN